MLELKNLSVRQGNFNLRSISFDVSEGDYFILLGISGAGKSVLLETIAGLIRPSTGAIILNGTDITYEKIQKRKIGLVFQDHAVFPHMTVRENIGYPLHGSHFSTGKKREQILKIAEKMNITSLLNRRPSTLSGGELQRVALARTLVQNPSVLLLDEPLASMDIQLRSELRSLLRQLNRSGQTIIHVTHDYEEAISLANRIAVINDGQILQTGTPDEVFQFPRTEFVAHFTGARNFFPASIRRTPQAVFAMISDNLSLHVSDNLEGEEGFVIIRSEDIILSNDRLDSSATNNLKGIVSEIIPSTHGIEIRVICGLQFSVMITRDSLNRLGLSEGKEIWMSMKASAVRFIPKELVTTK
ncbi:MAG: ABC transporter ATP-binding protein [Bacteroidota bacterium]|nr:ABC transporter ATP-binding protein [Bacteroidota bacterium]